MIEIREVRTRKELRKFVDFPYRLYGQNPMWVPPLRLDEMATLRWDKNPAFEFCEAKYWLAWQDGMIVGRIAGIINHKVLEKWAERSARFGWLDFIDDQRVAEALLSAVEDWAKSQGMNLVKGPLGFCDLDKEGLLVEGFDEPGGLTTIYNFPYYPEYLEACGYGKDVDWVEYELKVPSEGSAKLDRVSDAVRKRLKLRVLDAKRTKDLLPYAPGIFELINEAYKDLYEVIPLTEKQIQVYTKQYISFMDPDYVKIIVDENDQMAAFVVAMPSLSKALRKANGRLFPLGIIHILRAMKKNDVIDLLLVAVRPDLQGKGVNSLLMTELAKSCIKNKVVWAESNPQLEYNAKVQAIWKHYDKRQHKRRRSYVKEI